MQTTAPRRARATTTARHRRRLPQLGARPFLTDSGLETTLVFHDGLELPCFAAYPLLADEQGTARLRRYYLEHAALAARHGAGFVLESPTWRANPDWGARLGHDSAALADANRRGVGLMLEVRDALAATGVPMVVSGNIGPRGDGYVAARQMGAAEARDYHAEQIEVFAGTDADMIAAFTLNYAEEAIGIVQAAQARGLPVAIAFTLETDGRLPSGEALAEAIRRTDAATAGGAAYFMLNCAHPDHFGHVLDPDADWCRRIRGLRANASRRSHAELDASTDLDAGDPEELGEQYRRMRALLPGLTVLGGCCGTDHRHVEAIGSACCAARPAAGTPAAIASTSSHQPCAG